MTQLIRSRGALFVVATPIGNLEDITERARRVLGEVDAILAEDTRRTSRLLGHLAIATPLIAYHDHNERALAPRVVERMQSGERFALVSDAGTPLLSDPGFWLVRSARAAGLMVIPVPGPTALATALSVAGLPTDRFVFEGFLPAKASARNRALEALAREPRTMVFYEAPHRIVACVHACRGVFTDQRTAVLARELTKRFETVVHGSLADLADWLAANSDQVKGEFVLMIGGNPDSGASGLAGDGLSEDVLLRALLEVMPPGRAAGLAGRVLGRPRKAMYARAVQLAASAESE